MDVLCVGMYRSCSTWQYNICAELVERKAGGKRLGFIAASDYAPSGLPSQSIWRVLKTHDGHDRFAAALREGQVRAVYSRRDLRDVVFSIMHKWSISFDEVVAPNGLLEACIAVDGFWPSLPNVLCQSYETITADPSTAVKEIAEHLGLHIESAEADELSFEFSLIKNKERADAIAQQLHAEGVDLTNPENCLRYHSRTLFHWNHIRDGVVGGWRTLASPQQRKVLAGLCGSWLVEHGYECDL